MFQRPETCWLSAPCSPLPKLDLPKDSRGHVYAELRIPAYPALNCDTFWSVGNRSVAWNRPRVLFSPIPNLLQTYHHIARCETSVRMIAFSATCLPPFGSAMQLLVATRMLQCMMYCTGAMPAENIFSNSLACDTRVFSCLCAAPGTLHQM